MALTLIKEDGTGNPDANTYANIADADAYHEGRLNPLHVWADYTSDLKQQGLVTATRVIDDLWQFNGWRANDAQALQWPRERCPDPDRGLPGSVLLVVSGNYFDANVVPKLIVDATCELARELLGHPLPIGVGRGTQRGRERVKRRVAHDHGADPRMHQHVVDSRPDKATGDRQRQKHTSGQRARRDGASGFGTHSLRLYLPWVGATTD